jgi:hypothetical protein
LGFDAIDFRLVWRCTWCKLVRASRSITTASSAVFAAAGAQGTGYNKYRDRKCQAVNTHHYLTP